ncbi:MAG: Glutamate synthase [NADPH] large chain [uncultured Rubellimicrobium sp.]|uniref:Glutamate synthase [NADPH] large chain n=1 Tax=uncultured Rubellimicrobium sp. TaxID=543078 RepID=A0A6J4NK56_9RHOB|nr:MAG: Glutamate synthase [NADPH] large chain [uncultured Rubellimicrobium sp.]
MKRLSGLWAPVLTGAMFLLGSATLAQQADLLLADGPATLVSSSAGMSFGDALNQVRSQSGLGALRQDAHLTGAAQAFAEDMARHGYFSHQGRDGSTVSTRVRAAGCRGRGYFAENIAWGQRTAQSTFDGWMASSGHRRNMLGENYGAYGLGQSGGYWVLVFADGC